VTSDASRGIDRVAPLAPSARVRARNRGKTRAGQPSSILVALLIMFITIEYVRDPLLQSLRIQTLLLFVLPLAWLASRERPWSLNLTLLVVFIVAGIAMMPFAVNYFVIYMNARMMYGALVTAIATTWLLAYRNSFKRVVWAWVLIIALQAAWGITHGGHGYGDALGDENDLSLAICMAVPFALVGVQYLRGAKRWACAALLLVLVIGTVTSFSRGGFLGLIAAGGYGLLAVGRHRIRNFAIACVVATVFYLSIPSDYANEMGTMTDTKEGTAEARFFVWIAAYRIWLDYPILGAGPENSSLLLGMYQPGPTEGGMFSSPAYQERSWSMAALHSVYFQVLSERGFVGISLFAWITFVFYRGLRRLRRDVWRVRGAPRDLQRDAEMYALALESAMTGFLVAGAFLSVLYYPYFWFFSALAVAHERAIRREHPRRTRVSAPNDASSPAGTG
jgi:hypothetical protein